MPDTYTIPFGASDRRLLKPYARKINWEGINSNYDDIAAEFQDHYDSLDALSSQVDAISLPIFSASVGPFMYGTTFPIIGSSGGTPFQIETDLISKMVLWNAPPSGDYFISSVTESTIPDNNITLTVSSWDGASAVDVSFVTVHKTDTDAGIRDFQMDQMPGERIYGGLLAGDGFVTALAAVAGSNTTNFTFVQTGFNYYSVGVMEAASSATPTGAHIHRTFATPVGTQDGSNKTFSSIGAEIWDTTSLMVYLNGVPYAPAEITVVTTTSFTLASSVPANRIPDSATGAELRVSYVVNL